MDYLSVLGCQLKVILDCNRKDEFLITDIELLRQIEIMKELVREKKPDILVIPEMSFLKEMSSYYKKISKDMLVIAGSIYKDGINYTKVFQNGIETSIPKCNASGAEPMIRNVSKCSSEEFINNYLNSHTFDVRGKKIVVLNCMEYYQHAYMIARFIPDLFGIVCICSNNNAKVFIEESKAIHNHNENIYTFMINAVSTYKGEEYAKGISYIFGPIQGHEKEWLEMEGVTSLDHVSSILKLGSEEEYFYGEFLNDFSRFGRSDNYINSPRNVEVGTLRKKVLK